MMKRSFILTLLLVAMISCKIGSNSDHPAAEFSGARSFQLRLDPLADSKYDYDITSRSEFKVETEQKKIDNQSKVEALADYVITKDSTGNFVFHISYEKFHVYTKNGDAESELDEANAASSTDPVEKLLGSLKEANIVAVVNPMGAVRSVSGFKELRDKYMAQFPAVNSVQSDVMRDQWDNTIGDGLVKNNMDQLFRIFPDSAVHIGAKWQLASKQKGEIPLNLTNSFALDDIHDGTVFIESEGEITSDSVTQFMGYNVTTNLKGREKGEYQLEVKTGMVKKASVDATVEGTLQLMGQDIPVKIETEIKMERRQ